MCKCLKHFSKAAGTVKAKKVKLTAVVSPVAKTPVPKQVPPTTAALPSPVRQTPTKHTYSLNPVTSVPPKKPSKASARGKGAGPLRKEVKVPPKKAKKVAPEPVVPDPVVPELPASDEESGVEVEVEVVEEEGGKDKVKGTLIANLIVNCWHVYSPPNNSFQTEKGETT